MLFPPFFLLSHWERNWSQFYYTFCLHSYPLGPQSTRLKRIIWYNRTVSGFGFFFCLLFKQFECSNLLITAWGICVANIWDDITLFTVKKLWQTRYCDTEIVSGVHGVRSSVSLGLDINTTFELKVTWLVVSCHNMSLGCVWKYTLSKHPAILTQALSEDEQIHCRKNASSQLWM